MRAFSIKEPGKIEMIDIPQPDLGPEQVLIKVRYVGLCGTDLKTYKGLMPMVSYPRIPGHEISGVIEEKGPTVPERIKVGDKVVILPYKSCGQCSPCRIGRVNCCQFNQTLGVQRDGGLREYLAVHYSKIYSHPSLGFAQLTLTEPLSVGYHAANRGRVSENDTVLVLGCGVIGIGAVTASAIKGAKVIALDIDKNRLTLARKFGAQYIINSKEENMHKQISELTNGEGVSVAIEAVGLPTTFVQAVEMTAYADRIVYIGYTNEKVCYDTTQFMSKEIDIMGSRNSLHLFPIILAKAIILL